MIIFMGMAGSGKSIQGKLLADQFGYPWLSTGEFLRMLISGERRHAMQAGQLLNDKEIIQLVQKIFALIDTHDEFVLDGFPRTIAQADWLLNQAKHGQLQITAVLHMKASEKVVHERLTQRGRQDDNPEAISERFKEYEQAILPILADFKRHAIPVFDIDAEASVEQVHATIEKAIRSSHADQN